MSPLLGSLCGCPRALVLVDRRVSCAKIQDEFDPRHNSRPCGRQGSYDHVNSHSGSPGLFAKYVMISHVYGFPYLFS